MRTHTHHRSHTHHKGQDDDKFWGRIYAFGIIFLILLPCLALWMWLKAHLTIAS